MFKKMCWIEPLQVRVFSDDDLHRALIEDDCVGSKVQYGMHSDEELLIITGTHTLPTLLGSPKETISLIRFCDCTPDVDSTNVQPFHNALSNGLTKNKCETRRFGGSSGKAMTDRDFLGAFRTSPLCPELLPHVNLHLIMMKFSVFTCPSTKERSTKSL